MALKIYFENASSESVTFFLKDALFLFVEDNFRYFWNRKWGTYFVKWYIFASYKVSISTGFTQSKLDPRFRHEILQSALMINQLRIT